MKELKNTYLSALIIIFALFSSISLIASSPLASLSQDKILPADEAFKFTVHRHSENRIILRWAMKENCFLYKEKFNIHSETENIESIKITGTPNEINDIYFGEVTVYFDSVSLEILLNNENIKLDVSYQGCNERGFCYPTINKVVDVSNLSVL
jgi:thiol:disulfide interchange protein DsbD